MNDLSVTVLSRTVEALRMEIEALKKEARYDQLTGLGNRRLLEERSHGRGGYFVAIDLNGFKAAQDAHPSGHAYGDEILRHFARFLWLLVGEDGRVACRTGGDEFTVWCAQKEAAFVIAERIEKWEKDGVTASVGVGNDAESADREMYQSKAR